MEELGSISYSSVLKGRSRRCESESSGVGKVAPRWRNSDRTDLTQLSKSWTRGPSKQQIIMRRMVRESDASAP